MSCAAKAIGALVSIVVTGKVTDSSFAGVKPGDEVTFSFMAERKAPVREIPGQGVVYDNISPHLVCTEDFEIAFNNNKHMMNLGPIPPVCTAPPPYGICSPGNIWFSTMQKRPVNDGAWVSTSPGDGTKAIPVAVHAPGNDGVGLDNDGNPMTFGAWINLSFLRNTIPSLELSDLVGQTFGVKHLNDANMKIYRSWEANTVINIKFESLAISDA